jgi:hypothetical protein
MFKDTKDLDKKSYAVYAFPLLAVLCVILGIAGLRSVIPVAVMMMASGAVALIGLYKLKTLDLSALAVEIIIGPGLWYTLYAFLAIFFVSMIWLALLRD